MDISDLFQPCGKSICLLIPEAGSGCAPSWFFRLFYKMELISPTVRTWVFFPDNALPPANIFLFQPEQSLFCRDQLRFNSCRQMGCVISPVPSSVIPFFRAQRSSISGVPSLMVAMEYLECMCRSAICSNFFLLYHLFLCPHVHPVFFNKNADKEITVFFVCLNDRIVYNSPEIHL